MEQGDHPTGELVALSQVHDVPQTIRRSLQVSDKNPSDPLPWFSCGKNRPRLLAGRSRLHGSALQVPLVQSAIRVSFLAIVSACLAFASDMWT
jgi:hypothetical protein